MTISGSGAAGTGSAADPIVVEKGGTYSMSVEPRASLSLAMTLDTVVCRDLKELTAMKDNIRTADSGSSPLLKNTVQTFNIGGQEIVFPTELPLPIRIKAV